MNFANGFVSPIGATLRESAVPVVIAREFVIVFGKR